MKIFGFQFVNSYGSFFYVAFFASKPEFNKEACESPNGCCGIHGCMYSLGLNLLIIFGTRLAMGNIMEIAIPYITDLLKRGVSCVTRTVTSKKDTRTRPEREMSLNPYDTSAQVTADFSEVAIQMGYQTLFACALPSASTLALVSNIIDIRGGAWQLLRMTQRPNPMMVEDIGAFQTIFTVIAIVSVVTNALLIRFTMSTLNSWGEYVFCYTIVLSSFLVHDVSLCLSLIHLLLPVSIILYEMTSNHHPPLSTNHLSTQYSLTDCYLTGTTSGGCLWDSSGGCSPS
jgi:hypothetical protein